MVSGGGFARCGEIVVMLVGVIATVTTVQLSWVGVGGEGMG